MAQSQFGEKLENYILGFIFIFIFIFFLYPYMIFPFIVESIGIFSAVAFSFIIFIIGIVLIINKFFR